MKLEAIYTDSEENLYIAPRDIVYHGRTAIQTVLVTKHGDDRVLYLDGYPQTALSEDAAYHECFVIPAAMISPNVYGNALVVGCAEGSTVREVRKLARISQVTQVDIDPELYQLCRQYFNQDVGEPDEFFAQDALEYMTGCDKQFGVLYYAVPEIGTCEPSHGLYSEDALHLCKGVLNPGGVMVAHCAYPYETYQDEARQVIQLMRDNFENVRCVPCFEAHYLFVVGSDGPLDLAYSKSTLREGATLRYWGESLHRTLDAFPRFFTL